MGGKVTAMGRDVITEKSGHTIAPIGVSVCTTPATPSPLPIPYPIVSNPVEGISDAPMRTKINGARIATVGACTTRCHGNEAGTLKEVLSLNTSGPNALLLGAPTVICELGMMGITGSIVLSNKAPASGAGTSADAAGGAGGARGGGTGSGGNGGSAAGPGGPGGGGGSGGGGSNEGAGSSSGPRPDQCTTEGHPVNVATGDVVDEAVDLSLPGLIPLVWTRRYSSARREDVRAAYGPGWRHALEQEIVEQAGTTTLHDGDGRRIFFARVEPGETTFHRRERLELRRDGDGSYRVFSLDTRLTRVFAAAEGGDCALRLQQIEDAWGNAIRLEYDGARLMKVTDTAGRALHVKWQDTRIVRVEVRAEGHLEQWVDYVYSSSGCLIAAIDTLNHADLYEYDVHRRMTATVLKNGVRFQYRYEGGRCKRTWGPKGLHDITLRADAQARNVAVEGEEPKVYTYDHHDLVVREAMPDGALVRERAYDEDCYLIAETNGAGEGTQQWHDERGNLIRVVDATGCATSWEYERDRPARRIAADGLVTEYTHDARGALTGISLPTGERYALRYDDRGRLVEIQDGAGPLVTYAYDAQHNLAEETDARGAKTTYAYDAMGRAVRRTDGLGRTTRISYDQLRQPVSIRRADGTSTSAAYDPLGNVVRAADALRQVTEMEYAGTGVLTKVRLPNGETWAFKYNNTERLIEIKNPRGETYTLARDEQGRVAEERTFDGRAIAYRFSGTGRLARIDYPDGTFRGFEYDRAGRVIGERSSDGDIAYQRDSIGRLLAAILEEAAGSVATRYERGIFGRVIAEVHGDRRIAFAYDARGQRTVRTMPDGATTRYSYDRLGALIGVEHAGHRVAIERDLLGRETRMLEGRERFAIASAYDTMDRLIEQRATAPSPEDGVPRVLVARQWRYDANGRVRAIDDARWGRAVYEYDRVGQLVAMKRGEVREVFSYDPAGAIVGALERLSSGGDRAAPWEIGPGNLLQRTAAAKYTYDKRGRRAVKLALSKDGSHAEDATEYTWDCRDRLRALRLPSGDRVRFTYDAFGRRVRKEIVPTSGGAARVVEFLWDGDVLAADIDRDRGMRCFVTDPGTFWLLLQAERGEVFTYVNDHLGTPKELIDPAGRVAWSAVHAAFGAVVETWADEASERPRGRRVETPFRLLGQYADEETGLCCTQHRYFDPEVGRWCSPDPIGIGGGFDLFGFGTPTSDVDPFGLATLMQIGTYDEIAGPGNVGDGLDGHELLQNAWLTENEITTGRNSEIGKQNPAIALPTNTRPGIHQTIGTMQREAGLYETSNLTSMTATENINANAAILERAMIHDGVDPAVAKAKTEDLKRRSNDFADKHVTPRKPCKR